MHTPYAQYSSTVLTPVTPAMMKNGSPPRALVST